MVPKAAHCSTFKQEAQSRDDRIRNREQMRNRWKEGKVHTHPIPRARTPVRQRGPGLMSDEVREEVGQNSEQGQTADAVAGENPGSAAFMMSNGRGGCGGLLTTRRDNRGPIFHAKTSRRKDRGARTLCVTPRPASWRGKVIYAGFYSRFGMRSKKYSRIHAPHRKIDFHIEKTNDLLEFPLSAQIPLTRDLGTLFLRRRGSRYPSRSLARQTTWDNRQLTSFFLLCAIAI